MVQCEHIIDRRNSLRRRKPLDRNNRIDNRYRMSRSKEVLTDRTPVRIVLMCRRISFVTVRWSVRLAIAVVMVAAARVPIAIALRRSDCRSFDGHRRSGRAASGLMIRASNVNPTRKVAKQQRSQSQVDSQNAIQLQKSVSSVNRRNQPKRGVSCENQRSDQGLPDCSMIATSCQLILFNASGRLTFSICVKPKKVAGSAIDRFCAGTVAGASHY